MEIVIIIGTLLATAPITILVMSRLMRAVFSITKHTLSYLKHIIPTYEEIKAAYMNIGWYLETAERIEEDVPQEHGKDSSVVHATALGSDEEYFYSNLVDADLTPHANSETLEAIADLLVKLNSLGICQFIQYGGLRIVDNSSNIRKKLQIIILNRDQRSRDYFINNRPNPFISSIFYNPYIGDVGAEAALLNLVNNIISSKNIKPATYDVPSENSTKQTVVTQNYGGGDLFDIHGY